MKTIQEYIDTVKLRLKDIGDDHVINLPDETIADTLISKRALLLTRKAKTREAMHPLNWMTVCMPLTKGKYADCDCLPDGLKCQVLRSTSEVPHFIMGRRKGLVNIRKFNGKTLFPIDPEEVIELEYSKSKKDDMAYSFENKDLLVWDFDLRLKAIVINMIPVDPMELASITMCDSSGNPTNAACYNPKTEPFPIDGDLGDNMIELTLEHFLKTKRVPEDLANDGKDENR